jgi:hypothetical protein
MLLGHSKSKQMKVLQLLFLLLSLPYFAISQNDSKLSIDNNIKVIETKKPDKKDNKEDIRFVLLQSILRESFLDSMNALPLDEAHLISIAISFDPKGNIDSIYFSSKMSTKLWKFIGDSRQLKILMRNSITKFDRYKNVVILFPVLFHYMDHRKIGKDTFMEEYLQMWPTLSEKDSLKKLILLEPYIQGVRLRVG